VPPLLYATSDGALCSAHAAADGSRGGQLLASRVLAREGYALNSFDVEPAAGQDILAATGDEHLVLLHRGDE
jgi:hypothetical protein